MTTDHACSLQLPNGSKDEHAQSESKCTQIRTDLFRAKRRSDLAHLACQPECDPAGKPTDQLEVLIKTDFKEPLAQKKPGLKWDGLIHPTIPQHIRS